MLICSGLVHRLLAGVAAVGLFVAAGASQAVTIDITSGTNFNNMTASGGSFPTEVVYMDATGSLIPTSPSYPLVPDTVYFDGLSPSPTEPYGVATGGDGISTASVFIGSNFEIDVFQFNIDVSVLALEKNYGNFPVTIDYFVFDEVGNSLSGLDGSVVIQHTVATGPTDVISGERIAISSGTAIGQVDLQWLSPSASSSYDLLFDSIVLTPEPATLMLLGLGGLALACSRPKQR